MKRLLIVLLACGMALPAMAFLGQPIADDAHTAGGMMRVTGALTFESDVNLYGGRFTYGIMDGMAVFGGIGLIDPDGMDSDLYLQLGGQFLLPVDLPVDIALRGAFGITSFEESQRDPMGSMKVEMDVWTLSAGALVSMPIDAMFTVYGFGGLSYQNVETSWRVSGLIADGGSFRGSSSDSDIEPALAGGAIFTLNENISFFGELAHIDDLFLSLGARFDF